MKVTKVFHSCILVEENGVKILIDPGTWGFDEGKQNPTDFSDVAAVLVTHEHQDHLHPQSLREIGARIITNKSIAAKLKEEGINTEVLSPGKTVDVSGMKVRALDCPHGILPVPGPENTGFVLNDKIFHPGDCVTVKVPNIPILLVPVIAPWMRLVEGIDFTKSTKPKIAVPIHDGFMKYPFVANIFEKVISESGIQVKAKNAGESFTF